MHPERLLPGNPRLIDMLSLIQQAFSAHDGRIDPPSSMHRLTVNDLSESAQTSEVWVIGAPPVACVILTPKEDALYLSKLAVAKHVRREGHARHLIEFSVERARALGLHALELQTRVELVENHTAFERLGFQKVGATCHPGYEHPTSTRMRRPVRSEGDRPRDR